MQTKLNFSRTALIAAMASALTLGAASSFAGEAEYIMPEPMTIQAAVPAETPVADAAPEATVTAESTFIASRPVAAISREQVRQELAEAREAGTLITVGEAGDTPQVLAARDAFNLAQGEAIMAAYVAEQNRDIALAQAEERRASIEAEGILNEQVGVMAMAPSDDQSPEVRIDVVRLTSE